MVIAVAHFLAAGGPASSQFLSAFWTANKSSQGKVRVIALFRYDGGPLAGDDLLGFEENFPADDGFVDCLDVFREPFTFDETGVKRISQQAVDKALGGFLVTKLSNPCHDIDLLIETCDEFLKSINDIFAIIGWDDEGFVAIIPGALVSERRAPAPAALLDRLFHAVSRAFAFDIILELRKGADYVAHELSDGIFSIVLSCGEQTDAERAEVLDEFGLIREVTGESVVFPDDESGELLFILNAILDEVLELGAILGFGAFTALDEDFNDLKALIESELTAFFFLAFEAVASLSLLFG